MALPDTAGLAFEPLLEMCKRHIHTLSDIPELLQAEGFTKTAETSMDRSGVMRAIGFTHPARSYGITCFVEGGTKVKGVALTAADTDDLRTTIEGLIATLPNLVDRTRDAHRFAAAMPTAVRQRVIQGHFWSTKAPGECGLNLGICPAALGPLPALDFTIERNLALEDRITPAERASLTGAGSKLLRMIDLFLHYGADQAPDPDRIAERMAVDGYSLTLSSSGRRTATLYPAPDGNRHDLLATVEVEGTPVGPFEFALGFRLDPRLTTTEIRTPLFATLAPDTPQQNGIARIIRRDVTYTAEHRVHDATFGNHYFILRRA